VSEIDEIDYTPMLPFLRYYSLADEVLDILTEPSDTPYTHRIAAIKHVRDVTGWFLFESKKFVDFVQQIVNDGADIDLIASRRQIRRGNTTMKHLTKDEIRRLLEVAKSHSERNWLIILVAYRHGMRASEIVGKRGLTNRDIRDGEIVIKRLKGSLKTTQPLGHSSDPLFDEKTPLEALAAQTDGVLFPITRQMFWLFFQQYREEAGLKKTLAHPHILKHSIACHSIQAAGIENVRQHLGHKSLASTGAYLRVDDETASKAVAAACGL
jgi:integrase